MPASTIVRLMTLSLALFAGLLGGFVTFDRLRETETMIAVQPPVPAAPSPYPVARPLRWSASGYVTLQERDALTLVQVRGALVPTTALLR